MIPIVAPAGRRCVIVAAFLATAAGCGGPPMGAITGTVRFEGAPVASGRLTVLCEGGDKPVFFAEIKDGVYRIDRAPVGAARVTVQANAAQRPSAEVPVPPGAAPPLPIPASVPRVGKPLEGFPERYLKPDTSGLTFEIVPGPQTRDFDLTRR